MGQFGTVENDVLFGRDGELFLASGGHHVLEFATGSRPIDPAKVATFATNLAHRKSYAEARGCIYKHVVFPDKQSVLSDLYITPTPVCLGRHYIDALPDDSQVFYPSDILKKIGRKSFLQTDTHMTSLGTIVCVAQLVGELKGVSLGPENCRLFDWLTVDREHVGDLGVKLSPHAHSIERFATTPWPRQWFHNGLVGGNNGIVDVYISSEAVYPERLLWFGDSFGREAAKFLSYFFSEVVFLRTPYFHPEFVDAMQPRYVITENAERYLGNCLSDEDRPLFHMFPFLSGREYKPSEQFAEAFSALMSYPRPPYRQFITGALAKLQKQPSTRHS